MPCQPVISVVRASIALAVPTPTAAWEEFMGGFPFRLKCCPQRATVCFAKAWPALGEPPLERRGLTAPPFGVGRYGSHAGSEGSPHHTAASRTEPPGNGAQSLRFQTESGSL